MTSQITLIKNRVNPFYIVSDDIINGDVETYADLPGTANLNDVYIVRTTTGIFGNRKLAGLYVYGVSGWVAMPIAMIASNIYYDSTASGLSANTVKGAIDELAASNLHVTSASFNTSNGVLTLTLNDSSTVSVDLDGRYLENIIEDLNPQLGGNLDLNNQDINGTGNINITGEITATTLIGDMRGATVFQAKAGEALTKGDPVYISGDDVTGNKPIVSIADANDANKMPCFGLANETVSINANVNVVTFGTLNGLDTSSYNQGDILYISTTGTLTSTKPSGESSLIQNIGKVIRSHASAGSIKVGGAGRTNDVPNLNNGNVFIGNASNQAETRSLVKSDVGLANVENINVQNSFTQNSGQYIATEGIRARDIGGIALLNDDGTAGVTVADDGVVDIIIKLLASEIRARNANGLKLYNDGGSGIFVADDGKVGIGNNSPVQRVSMGPSLGSSVQAFGLGVEGSIVTGTEDYNNVIGLNNYGAGSKLFSYNYGNNTGTPIYIQPDNANVYLANNGGNVGIGNDTPSERLEISGNLLIDSQLKIKRIGYRSGSHLAMKYYQYAYAGGGLYDTVQGALEFRAAQGWDTNDLVLTLYSEGFGNNYATIYNKLGIGKTPTDTAVLDMERSETSGGGLSIRLKNTNTTSGSSHAALVLLGNNGAVQAQYYADGFGGTAYLRTYTNHPISIGTNATERMRIENDGKVRIHDSLGIGMDPTQYAALDMEKSVTSGAGAQINLKNTASGPSYAVLNLYGNNGDVTGQFYAGGGTAVLRTYTNHGLIFGTNATERARITNSGNFGIGTNSPSQKLHVNGNAIVSGSLSKGSGSFDIAHPDPAKKDTHRLRHYFVETPSAGGNIYKYQLNCNEGDNYMDLPDYFEHLNQDSLVWVNPFKHFGRAWGEVIDGGRKAKIVVEQGGIYNILIFGDRKDAIAMQEFEKYGVEYENKEK